MNINELKEQLKIDEITPVEYIDGLYLKRDDKYAPIDFIGVNGTKLRQCACLLIKNFDKISNGVITCCSIHSPQGLIVTSLCKYIGVKSTVLYGGTTEDKLPLRNIPNKILNIGGNIDIVSKMGRLTVLNSKAKKRASITGEFIVEHGMDLMENIDCFLESVANQVSNLPSDLENLVITCGSGISTTGILYGIQRYRKNIKNIYLVGVAPNREQRIKSNIIELGNKLGVDLKCPEFIYVDLFNTKGFRYEKKELAKHKSVNFHPNYEAKTYNWLKENIDYKNNKTCLWVIGGDVCD